MRIWTVDEAVKMLLRSLPRGIASAILSVWAISSWITLPINFVSQVAQLRIAINAWIDLYTEAVTLRPVLSLVAEVTGPVLRFWQSMFDSIQAWVRAVLHVSFPDILLHGGYVRSFV